MAQENVEELRAFCKAWNAGGELDMSLLDPDVAYEDEVLPDVGVASGMALLCGYAELRRQRPGRKVEAVGIAPTSAEMT
jgi:hypothetical protein